MVSSLEVSWSTAGHGHWLVGDDNGDNFDGNKLRKKQ